jgi:flagellar M-ring protein FliF
MTVLENIVKRAVNFDESRGDKVEVANIPFTTEEVASMEPETKNAVWDGIKSYASFIKYVAAAIFVIFSFVYVIRPLIQWLTDTPWEDVELLEQLPRTVAQLEKQYANSNEGANFVSQAAQLISANQDDSSRMMKQWLKET